MTDQEFMRMAVEKGRQGIAAGQSPFGAVVVRGGELVAAAHNTVWLDCDPTAHAEVNAIRQAARALGRIDLGGCEMFTTCEPCPMCLSAIHWSKIARVVFAATIDDAAAAGFSELRVGAQELAKLGGSALRVELAASREEGRALFQEWRQAGGRSY
ncbi:MAG: nucleoside deaminase [Terriglobales bacterium]